MGGKRIVKSNLFKPFKKHTFTCEHEGEIVTCNFGGQNVTMHYADIFKITQMMNVHAKLAKTETGDKSTTYNVMGVLRDAEDNHKATIPRHL
ncbi:unnamed protein product [marine sediment metagenome]|uniref:Uncharacterized protein n=1 Tax=marine sediment metagenome TaxID=412755 RepID=X0XQB4_9ZZZZ